jgi:hypothetical protein
MILVIHGVKVKVPVHTMTPSFIRQYTEVFNCTLWSLYLGKITSSSHQEGGWLRPRTRLDISKRILFPLSVIVQPFAYVTIPSTFFSAET